MPNELFDAPVPCRRCGGDGAVDHGNALCPLCRGMGVTIEKRPIPVDECKSCNGTGYTVVTVELPTGQFEHRTDPCQSCNRGNKKK